MKTIMKKFITFVTGVAIVLPLFLVSAPVASASVFNDDAQDFDTLRVVNYSQNPNTDSSQWGTSVSANYGDTINFAIYYHNTSIGDTAENVRVRLTPQSSTATNVTFTATLWADDASQVVGTATVNIPSSATISYDSVVIWRPNQTTWGSQTLLYGQNGNEIFNSNGLRLGDIEPGWDTQGSVIVRFKVSDNNNNNNNHNNNNVQPTVLTQSATSIFNNSALLRGYVDTRNNNNVSRWFEWGSNIASLNNQTTRFTAVNGTSNFNSSISGLAPNTVYYFRAVSDSPYGRTYGNTLNFRTNGNGGTNNTSSVITNSATNVTTNSALLNGTAFTNNNNSSQQNAWFQWGIGIGLGNTTSVRSISSASVASFNNTLFGLSPNTTYYYRAVVQGNNGLLSYGNTLTFRTTFFTVLPPVVLPPVVLPPVVISQPAARSYSINKTIENLTSPNGTLSRVDAAVGDVVRFTIEVENTGTTALSNVEIRDLIPLNLEFANAEDETRSNARREVVWFLETMAPRELEIVTLDLVVTESARIGSRITNTAEVESTRLFTETSNQVRIDVVGEVFSNLAASAFFGSGDFMPSTAFGWLFMFMLILVVLLLGSNLYNTRRA